MGERCRPRDLYDIINLFRRQDLNAKPEHIYSILIKKCSAKNIDTPTLESIQKSPYSEEIKNEWENMLRHQLQALPSFNHYWDELPDLFKWLEKKLMPKVLSPIPLGRNIDRSWSPSSRIRRWNYGTPIESIRFAGANYLCIELDYLKQGNQLSHYLIEPYAIRRTTDDELILKAIKLPGNEWRTFRLDWIRNIRINTNTFIPKFRFELY